jgi:hypothetical protein
MKTILVAAMLALAPTMGFTADIIAKAGTWGWTLSVIDEGSEWAPSCKLELVAETYKVKRVISLKRDNHNCALFGPVHLYAAEAPNHESAIVFFESARGGDGDHSGPIVEVFALTRQGFKKLGEQELFDATYHRANEQITSVTGKVLFSLCDVCDGPEAAEDEDNFYIPVKITIGPTGILVKPLMTKQERKALLERFDNRARIVLKENGNEKFVHAVRKELIALLGR